MDTLKINVEGWPPEWIDTVKNYAHELTAKFEGNGLRLPVAPKSELPKWPGIASVPPEKLRRDELYKDEGDE